MKKFGKLLSQPLRKPVQSCMQSNTAKNKVFLDSSMLIAAVLSSSGGSFYILSQWRDKFEFQINQFVFDEVNEVLSRKFYNNKEFKSRFMILLGLSKIIILNNSVKQKVRGLLELISKEDAPILASAIEHSSFLITLDNDFFTQKVLQFAQLHKLTILKPKDFILQNR